MRWATELNVPAGRAARTTPIDPGDVPDWTRFPVGERQLAEDQFSATLEGARTIAATLSEEAGASFDVHLSGDPLDPDLVSVTMRRAGRPGKR